MNYNQIGSFITHQRNIQHISQSDLANYLNIDEKELQKYETGKTIPHYLLPKICEILDVTLTELLSGEKLVGKDYTTKTVELLLQSEKYNQKLKKKIFFARTSIAITSILFFLLITIFAIYTNYHYQTELLSTIFILIATLILTIGCIICVYLETNFGYYTCNKCGHKHQLEFKKTILAPRLHRTLYLKCPHCQQKSWQKLSLD